MQFPTIMSQEKDPKDPMEELKKNLDQVFKHGNAFFPMGSGPNQPSGATAKTESSQPENPNEDDEERAEILRRIQGFNLKPKEIRDYLDRFVIQQQEAKKVISVAICDHYNHVRRCLENPEIKDRDYAKQNIILLGPTGVGKTYLMRTVAKLIGVPFVKADATKFSETGYVGGDVDDLVRDLVKNANGDEDLAQYGIIYIDEIDKIANKTEGGRDVSGRGVQINLLKLMEETDVNLQSQTDLLGQMQAMMDLQQSGKSRKKTLNTRHILFIVSGAFDKLGESVKKRLTTSSLGFGAPRSNNDEDSDEFLSKVETRDFIKYGYEPEFIGRLPVRVACMHLLPDDLLQILTSSEGSILAQYLADFDGYNIKLDVTKGALQSISEKAHKEKTGARGLMTILERVFRDFKFELPSTGIKRFEVKESTVDDPARDLKQLLRENISEQRSVLLKEVTTYAQRFEAQYGFTLDFDEDAAIALVEESLDLDKTIRALCEKKFRDFHHGLTLISRNTGQKVFPITESVVKNAEKELSDWVVKSYRANEESTSG
jgi:ATP-dependent Clp protease ATP-binding subunit ClpX